MTDKLICNFSSKNEIEYKNFTFETKSLMQNDKFYCITEDGKLLEIDTEAQKEYFIKYTGNIRFFNDDISFVAIVNDGIIKNIHKLE